jgi:membrane-bound serine protease (ClpP class)
MMIFLCIALIVLGIICLIVEAFVPGFGVFGLGGIACLVVSAVLAVLYVPFGWMMVTAEIVLLAGFFYFMYQFIKKRQLQGNLIMSEALNVETPELTSLDGFVGKSGLTVTALRPAGEVELDGVRLEAASEGKLIAMGVRVTAVKVQGGKLIVREEEGAPCVAATKANHN